MSLSRRELIMAGSVSAVVIGLVSWVIASPLIAKIQMSNTQQIKLNGEKAVLDKLISQRTAVQQDLETLRAQLPHFAQDEQVSAQIVSRVQQIAADSGVVLLRRDPATEQVIGDLSEISVDCQWEGTLENILKFLFAAQTQGAMLDIRQLNIQPHTQTTQAGRLKGNFKLFYAFMREKPGAHKATAPAATSQTNAMTTAVSTNVEAAGSSAPATNAVPATSRTSPAPVTAPAPVAAPAAMMTNSAVSAPSSRPPQAMSPPVPPMPGKK